jgi:tetratricopeptide (TPR) repeat protein
MIASFTYPVSRAYLHVKLSLLLLIALRLSVCAGWAQTSDSQIAFTPVRIAKDAELIRIAEQEHRSDAERGALWSQLALEYHYAAEFQKAEEAYDKSLHLLKSAPSAKAEYASTLESLASLYLIYGRVDEAESVRKQALAVREKIGNPSDIGFSHVHLANIATARRQFKKESGWPCGEWKRWSPPPNLPGWGYSPN